jgi:hypothetical protein
VAWFLCSPVEAKEASDERGLTGGVVLRQPPDLSLADHVHRFDSLKRSPRRVKRSESLTRSDPTLDASMVLFDDIVEVPYWSAVATAAKFAGTLQFRNHFRI